MTNQSYRQACSIELDDKVIITGGWKSGGLGIETVAVYDANGFVEYLPDLRFGRLQHGCGHYINSNNEIVSFIIRMNLITIIDSFSGVSCDRR